MRKSRLRALVAGTFALLAVAFAVIAAPIPARAETLSPGTYSITANLSMPGKYNPIISGLTVYPSTATNPFGPTHDENMTVISALPSSGEVSNAQLIVGTDGSKTLYLPIKNPIFTTQDLGTCSELSDVSVERVAPTHYAENSGTWEGSYNKRESRIHKMEATLTDDQTSGTHSYYFKGSVLYAVPLDRDLAPDGDVALQLDVDYDSAKLIGSSIDAPTLNTEKIVVNEPSTRILPADFANNDKEIVYNTAAYTVESSDDKGIATANGVKANGSGAYEVKCTLTDTGKYAWANSKNANASAWYNVYVGALPTPDTSASSYATYVTNYNGEEQSVVDLFARMSGLSKEVVEQAYDFSGDYTATNAGDYTAKVTPKDGYYWAGYSSADAAGAKATLSFNWRINKASAFPKVTQTIREGETPTYEIHWFKGNYQAATPCDDEVRADPTYSEDIISVAVKDNDSGYTQPSSLPAGSYELQISHTGNFTNWNIESFLFPLVNANNKSYLTVEQATEVDKPEAATLTYSGTAQTGVSAGEGYRVLYGASGTNAGDYSTSVMLEPGYRWTGTERDPKNLTEQVDWSISKAPLTATYVGEQAVYGDAIAGQVSYSGFVNGEDETSAADFVAPTVSAPAATEVGQSYELMPAGGSAKNYEFSYAPGTLEILAKGIAPEPVAVTGLAYNGSEQTGVVESSAYTVEGGTATLPGDYTATVMPVEGYTWADGTADAKTVSWSIARATLTVTYAGETINYGETPALALTVSGFVNGEDAASAAGYVAPVIEAPSSVTPNGSYDLVPSGGSADYYDFAYVGGSLVVKALGTVDVPQATGNFTYDGAEHEGVAAAAEHVTLSGETKATKAGAHNATATLDEGYIWADGTTEPKTVTWSIAPARLKATYEGESMSLGGTFSGKVSVAGFVNGETAETAEGYVAPAVAFPVNAEAGKSYELSPAGGEAANYEFEYISGTLKIAAAESDGSAKPGASDDKGGKSDDFGKLIPQTGDTFSVAAAAMVGVAGLGLVCLGARRRG